MAFPSDIALPANAKYFSYIESVKRYNTNYDVVWSFQFAISSGNPNAQYILTTFLTNTPYLTAYPAQYGGYSTNMNGVYLRDETGDFLLTDTYERYLLEEACVGLDYLLTEDGEILLTEDGIPFIGDDISCNPSGLLGIAIDTTGLFALSSTLRDGVTYNNVKPYSLIVRNDFDNVLYNEQLSSINSDFFFLSSQANYQTIRVRTANKGNLLYIDYKSPTATTYTLLTSFAIDLYTQDNSYAYIGVSFSSPVSSSTMAPVTLYMKNFHIEGNSALDIAYEDLNYSPLYTCS